jgi:uncharacterized membrane protein
MIEQGTERRPSAERRSERRMSPWSGPQTNAEAARDAARSGSPHALAAAQRRARGLGFLSLGLGIAQLAAPRAFNRAIGLGERPSRHAATFGVGLRELATGLGLLSRRRPTGWLWMRVAGDVMDLAMLGRALGAKRANRPRVLGAMAAAGGLTILDLVTARQLARGRDEALRRALRVERTITVDRPPEEVYRFWRDFQNLPRFMAHVQSVQVHDERRSRWRVKGPAGVIVEWDAEVTQDRPGELLAWRSVGDADVANAGTVRFVPAPGGRGTEVHVELRYDPPAGRIGSKIAKLFGREPGQQAASDLRRFKQVMEVGEVVHSEASIHRGPHAARPPRDKELRRSELGGGAR